MTTTDDKIAALQREIEKLKATQPPTPRDAEAERKRTAEYMNEVHQMRERAANSFRFSPEIQRAMNAACSDDDLRDIARHGTVQSQSQVGAPHTFKGGSTVVVPPSATPGWREASPLGPPPGTRDVDRIAEEFARRDREELAQRLGKK
jgi:hypothetical protein